MASLLAFAAPGAPPVSLDLGAVSPAILGASVADAAQTGLPRQLRIAPPQAQVGKGPTLSIGVAATAALGAHRRRFPTARRAAKGTAAAAAAAAAEEAAEEEEQTTFAGVLPLARRRIAAVALGLLPSAAVVCGTQQAAHAYLFKDKGTCSQCGGKGTVRCGMCEGTGQFNMIGSGVDKNGAAGQEYAYYDCPQCLSAGKLLCVRCLATGLPKQQLTGIFRNPDYEPVTKYLTGKQIVNVYNVDEFHKLIKKTFAEVEAKKAMEAAAAL